jgi:hypothetical protein
LPREREGHRGSVGAVEGSEVIRKGVRGRRLAACERGVGRDEHVSPACQRTRGRGGRRRRKHHPHARGERRPTVGPHDTRSGGTGIRPRSRGRGTA